MNYVSKATIRSLSPTLATFSFEPSKSPDLYLAEAVQSAKQKSTFDVFLSHSFLDKDTISRVHAWLTRRGLSVYVDWITDESIGRPKVTKETAEVIRQRMRQSKSLLYCFSENAKNSRWMPWELGYFDGARMGRPIHLFPISDTEASIEGVEFTALYPVVERSTMLAGYSELYVRTGPEVRKPLVEAIKL